MNLMSLMDSYFDEMLTESATPIKPKASTKKWMRKEDPGRLVRTFKLEDEKKYNRFVYAVLEHQRSVNHHAKILVEFPDVTIEIYSHTVNDITEMDIDWARDVSALYKREK
jgi:pterin-4a-carbinolamine dehydratase